MGLKVIFERRINIGLLDGFKKLKRYIANEHGDYQLVSLWTHASTVVMDGDVSLKDSLDSKVNKTGDTLTGGLTINSATGSGNIVLKDTGFALDTSANNGVPQDEPRYKLLGAYDKNGRRFGVFQFAARDDGGTDVAMVATNMKTDGETLAGGIWASAEKDGTMNYSITQPAKFKEAIGLTDLGKRYTNFANKSITVADIDTEVEGASAEKLAHLICKVQKEISEAEQYHLNKTATGFDMVYIIDEQNK